MEQEHIEKKSIKWEREQLEKEKKSIQLDRNQLERRDTFMLKNRLGKREREGGLQMEAN